MRDFLLKGENNFVLYLTFHSCGQYIIYPWGYDKLDTKDLRDLQRVGNITNTALKRINNSVTYQVKDERWKMEDEGWRMKDEGTFVIVESFFGP